MKRQAILFALVGIFVTAGFAESASAMLHTGMGRFMQRDPRGSQHAQSARTTAPSRRAMAVTSLPDSTSRFVRRDPLSDGKYADGMNLYQYVRSSPATYTDPSGTTTFTPDNKFGDMTCPKSTDFGDLCGKEIFKAKISYCVDPLKRRYVIGRSLNCWYENCEGDRSGTVKGHEIKTWTEFDPGCLFCSEGEGPGDNKYPCRFKEHWTRTTRTGCVKDFWQG